MLGMSGAATESSTLLAQNAAWTLECFAQQPERKELGHMEPKLVLGGVIPANLMAFDADLEIDERNYRRHIRYLIDTPSVTGLTTNAHASEVATLTLEEQQGADCFLVFPSAIFDFGHQLRPEMAYKHIATVAEARASLSSCSSIRSRRACTFRRTT